MFWVCKTCGRSMKAEDRPDFCYFDRMDHIDSVNDEDAVKMGLDIPDGETYEFPGDVRYEPSGVPIGQCDGPTLSQFQDAIMMEVALC